MITIAKDTGMHLHLVAHNKKPDSFGKKSSRYDVKGASEISDLAFNVVIVERPEGDNGEKPEGQPDAWLKVAKQRNYNWKGAVRLYLQGETGAFSDNQKFMSVDFGTRKEHQYAD
jgi:twinkle protein